jgi:four helix bundle suffix protein
MAGVKGFKRRLILPHGGFRKWPAYRCAEVVYDATVKFCERFIKDFRLRDQMVHAARSGKQNIAEGSAMSCVSRKSELELIAVARASQQELLLDYEDFLRQRGMQDWDRAHPTKSALRRIAYSRDKSYNAYKNYVEEGSAELAANTIICLIHQTMFLLAKLMRKLEERFLIEGGFTERMHRMRSEARRAHSKRRKTAA